MTPRIGRAHAAGLAILLGLIPALCASGSSASAAARASRTAVAPAVPTAGGGSIAVVGTRRISRADFERAASDAIAAYERLRGYQPNEDVERVIRRQALERMIRTELLVLEAKRQRIAVSESEVDAEFRKHPFFNEAGHFDAARFAKVKAANSPEYRASVAEIRAELAGRKLGQQIEQQYAPDPAKLRADIERGLTRATLEYLALRASEFDGRFAEPPERDILDYYASHVGDFARVQRAELSVIQIGEATSARRKAVADSLIAAIQGGTTFEGASAGYGGARSKILVTPKDFPAYWQGDEATRAQVFRTAPGALLPAPVPGRDGLLIVRVDQVHPAGVAPLREVAREIRRLLREQTRSGTLDRELRAEYESRKSMLKTPAYKVRWAVIDTGNVEADEPTPADLESYYRGHLADYSAYDAASASIRTRGLNEVRGEVRAHWRVDRRLQLARLLTSRLEQAWRQGRRDRSAEAEASSVHEAGPVELGAAVDTGIVASIVSDSLQMRQGALGTGVAQVPDGSTLVFDVYQAIKDYVPSFEQYRRSRRSEQEAKRVEQEEQQARAMYERDPGRWASGRAVHFGEITVPTPDLLTVPLTHKEVETYHLRHLDQYSAPEEIRVRHILVSPDGSGPAADAAARRKAEDLLQRLKAGEDFAELARRYSDDPPTRDKGGDLGFFGRGAMLEPFERAAFALKPGEMSGVVKTEAGYHIIKLVDRLPLVAEPLERVYPNVGADAATEKAERIVAARCDSIMRLAHTPARLKAVGKQLGLDSERRDFNLGDIDNLPKDVQRYVRAIAELEPGEVLPRTLPVKGVGARIAWLDSIGPARAADWSQVRDRVIDEYRRRAVARALQGKRAELDSLMAAGWSADSVAALWGGFERLTGLAPGKGIVGLGGRAQVDSLVFGGDKPPALPVGELSGWVQLDRGLVRVRPVKRAKPGADAVSAKLESQRRLSLEHGLQDYFARLALSYPVHILDSDLAEISLPPVPEPTP